MVVVVCPSSLKQLLQGLPQRLMGTLWDLSVTFMSWKIQKNNNNLFYIDSCLIWANCFEISAPCQWNILLYNYMLLKQSTVCTFKTLSVSCISTLKGTYTKVYSFTTLKLITSIKHCWNVSSFDVNLCFERAPCIKLAMLLQGNSISGEHISMELGIPEPSVSLHLVPETRVTLGTTAVTSHHGIKDFAVSCKAGAGG